MPSGAFKSRDRGGVPRIAYVKKLNFNRLDTEPRKQSSYYSHRTLRAWRTSNRNQNSTDIDLTILRSDKSIHSMRYEQCRSYRGS